MKLTSSEANKLLKTYNEELNRLKNLERLSATFRASTGENIDDVRPDYDLQFFSDSKINIVNNIITLKHYINKFNNETVLPCGLTIDQALVVLPLLNDELSILSRLKDRLPKTRCGTFGSNGVVEYEYANYDINKALEIYSKTANTIADIQNHLDIANNTFTFEIEDPVKVDTTSETTNQQVDTK